MTHEQTINNICSVDMTFEIDSSVMESLTRIVAYVQWLRSLADDEDWINR